MLNKIVKYAMWVLMLVGIALTALVFAQNGSETSVNSLLIWAYAMLVIAILAIVYGIIRVVAQEPKKLIRMGAVVVGLVALVVVVYMVVPGNPAIGYTGAPVSAGTLKLTDTVIILTYIAIAGAVLSIIVGAIMGRLKT